MATRTKASTTPKTTPEKKPKKKRAPQEPITVNLQHCGYPIIHAAVKARGWKIAGKNEAWDVGWSDNNQMVREMAAMLTHPRRLQPAQRVNHFPNSKQLYRKDYLAQNMNALRAACPDEFSFSPISWRLPDDLPALQRHICAATGSFTSTSASDSQQQQQQIYIVKPAAGLQGQGIQMTTDPLTAEHVQQGRKCVVQHYVGNPLLIDGFKFDMRVYVLVTSIDPLKIYVYNDGLARLCTVPYCEPNTKNMQKSRMHLTNYAVNKGSKNFAKGEDGSKRSIKAVMDLLKAEGRDADRLWTNIVGVIVKSIIGVQPLIAASYGKLVPRGSLLQTGCSSCFEVWGYDVMADNDLNAWLLEVNHAPSFKGGSKVDNRVKSGVVSGALDLLGVSEKRKRILAKRVRKTWGEFMWQQALEKSREQRDARFADRASSTDRPASSIPKMYTAAQLKARSSPKGKKRSKEGMHVRIAPNTAEGAVSRTGTPLRTSAENSQRKFEDVDVTGLGSDSEEEEDRMHDSDVGSDGESEVTAAEAWVQPCPPSKSLEKEAEIEAGIDDEVRQTLIPSDEEQGEHGETGVEDDDEIREDENQDARGRWNTVRRLAKLSHNSCAETEDDCETETLSEEPEPEIDQQSKDSGSQQTELKWPHRAPTQDEPDQYIRVFWSPAQADQQLYTKALATADVFSTRVGLREVVKISRRKPKAGE